jgi:hypothetical protein
VSLALSSPQDHIVLVLFWDPRRLLRNRLTALKTLHSPPDKYWTIKYKNYYSRRPRSSLHYNEMNRCRLMVRSASVWEWIGVSRALNHQRDLPIPIKHRILLCGDFSPSLRLLKFQVCRAHSDFFGSRANYWNILFSQKKRSERGEFMVIVSLS